ncbi:MAG: ATP-binding cassette domain-containing protein [Reichenbachiella sp.]
MPILKTSNLTKHFGSRTAVNKLNLEIEKGQIFGLLGPNGSGKTTTLGMLLGVINANEGDFTWFDEQPSAQNRTRIGAILETPSFYPNMSAFENLNIVAKIKNCPQSRIEEVLQTVDLLSRQHDKFITFSLGMKQRLAIASALLADPEVLILDEPTNGLDPEGIIEIRNIIQQIAETGKTIILASHLLDEVQKVCSHFAVLKTGKLLHQGAIGEMTKGVSTIEIGASDLIKLESVLNQLPGLKKLSKGVQFHTLEIEQEVTTDYITTYLAENGLTPNHISKKQASLEQEFLKILANND